MFLFFSDGTDKTKLEILPLLYCLKFVKTSTYPVDWNQNIHDSQVHGSIWAVNWIHILSKGDLIPFSLDCAHNVFFEKISVQWKPIIFLCRRALLAMF